MLVSVVIPTFNRSDLIGETIASVLAQTVRDLEIIVVDDGSTDSTREVVTRFSDPRIRYVWQVNSGRPACARNAGIRLARGEFIALLDSDDLWVPEKLERQLEAFRKDRELWIVATNYRFFSADQGILLHIDCDLRPTGEEIALTNPIGNSSVVMRRGLVDLIGFFDENKKIVAIEDYDYWLRVIDKVPGSILILREPLMLYRSHEKSLNRLEDGIKVAEKHLIVLAKFRHSPFFRPLKRRLERDIKIELYEQLIYRKITLREFLKDGRMPARTRLVRGARFVVSRLVRGIPK